MARTRQPVQDTVAPNMCMDPAIASPWLSPLLAPSLGPTIGPAPGPSMTAARQPTVGNQALASNLGASGGGGPTLLETISNAGNVGTTIPSQLLARSTGQAAPLFGYLNTNMGMMQNGLGTVNNATNRGLGAAGAAFGLLQAPMQAGKLFGADTSTSDRLGAASNLTGTAKGSLEAAGMFGDLYHTRNAAMSGMTGLAPNASRSVLSAGANTAADIALGARTAGGMGVGNVGRAMTAANGGGTLAASLGVANRAAGTGVARAGINGAAHAGASGLGKAAARFAPGLNVAIAAMDTANFASTMMDDKASTGKKIFSGLTAAGSIASATNIPIVSQIGAGVSALSGLAGSFF